MAESKLEVQDLYAIPTRADVRLKQKETSEMYGDKTRLYILVMQKNRQIIRERLKLNTTDELVDLCNITPGEEDDFVKKLAEEHPDTFEFIMKVISDDEAAKASSFTSMTGFENVTESNDDAQSNMMAEAASYPQQQETETPMEIECPQNNGYNSLDFQAMIDMDQEYECSPLHHYK